MNKCYSHWKKTRSGYWPCKPTRNWPKTINIFGHWLMDIWGQWPPPYWHLESLTIPPYRYWLLGSLTPSYWHLRSLTPLLLTFLGSLTTPHSGVTDPSYRHLRSLTPFYWHLRSLTPSYWVIDPLILTFRVTDPLLLTFGVTDPIILITDLSEDGRLVVALLHVDGNVHLGGLAG